MYKITYYLVQDIVSGKYLTNYRRLWTDEATTSNQFYDLRSAKAAISACLSDGIPSYYYELNGPSHTYRFQKTFSPCRMLGPKILAKRFKIIEVVKEDENLFEQIYTQTCSARMKNSKISFSRFGKDFSVPDRKPLTINNLQNNPTSSSWQKPGHQVDIYGKINGANHIMSLGVGVADTYTINSRTVVPHVIAFVCVAKESQEKIQFTKAAYKSFNLTTGEPIT